MNTAFAIFVLLPVVIFYLYTRLYKWRFKKYSHIPQPFPSSLLFGHLKQVGEYQKRLGSSQRHADYMFELILKDAGHPQLYLLDFRPVNYPMVIVASHKIAEQISKVTKIYPNSVLKSPTLQGGFRRVIGAKSIVTEEGESWRSLRKRFNVGFAPQHLITLLPTIIEMSTTFMSKLDALAKSGTEFSMDLLCTDLTFDIIGKITTDIDLKAQDNECGGHGIVHHFRSMISTYSDTNRSWFGPNVFLRTRRMYHSVMADRAIKACIREKFKEIKSAQRTETKQNRDRSILALALKDVDVLTSENLQLTADQVKSFFFAGHDTTSILLQRLFYTLSVHPRCLEAMRAEHTTVFGDQDPRKVLVAKPEETIKALSYTSACIKEALRLWPPAGSARLSPLGKGFKVRLEDGQEVCLDGAILYVNHYLIQRDPDVYGKTANDFVPERWLNDSDTTSATVNADDSQAGVSGIPASAWRPFERGPRNCIGQELANIEARVILACVIRRYDFTKVGAGEVELDEKGNPVVNEKGAYTTKSELFNSSVITARPFDRCRMKTKIREA